MKKNFKQLLFIAIAFIASQAIAQLPAGYTKVFQDDFNFLNTNKWHIGTVFPYKRNRVKTRNGVLVMENKFFGGANKQGGIIKSKKTFKYGYFEARVRISKQQKGQIWPTWWLIGPKGKCGKNCKTTELDIMEYSGFARKFSENTPGSAHHFRQGRKLPGASNGNFEAVGSGKSITQWGIWSCLWTPTQIKMWHTAPNGRVSLIYTSKFAWDAERETSPLNLIFSTSPHLNRNNGDALNNPGHGPYPNEQLASFEVDWVKVWQKAPYNKIITLRKTGGDRKYVSANKYGDNELKAKTWNVRAWEKFRVVEHPQGGVALIANSNGKYVQVNGNNRWTPLKAKGKRNIPPRSWERFNWEGKGNGKVALLSFQTKSYVQANHKQNNAIIRPIGQRALPYETFDFKVIGNKSADGTIELTNKSLNATVYPNPFNQAKNNDISLDLELPALTDVSIDVVTLLGTKVYANTYPKLEEGGYTLSFTKDELNMKTTGVYLININAGEFNKVVKLFVE